MTPPAQRAAQGRLATRRHARRRIDASPLHDDKRIGYMPGSAIGARVAGAVWGVLMGSACLFGLLQGDPRDVPWFILLAPLFMIIRPWSLGIWLTDDGFVVKSWFRRYRIKSRDVVAIDLAPVHSGLLGNGTQYILFVGSVRMIEVELKDQWLLRWFPVTVGRRNRVLRLVRELREHTGAPPGGFGQ